MGIGRWSRGPRVALAAAAATLATALVGCQAGDTAGSGATHSPSGGIPQQASGASWNGLRACSGDLAAYQCGVLTVPLDRANPGSRRLELPVVVGGQVASERTMVFLTGGPGQGGVAAAPRVIGRFAAVAASQRIVLLDQRGTGANALQCPALQAQLGASDLTVPTDDAVTACGMAIGDDRAHYGTSDTVADLEDLRIALGASRLSLDGVSYGTYVAQRYASAHPDRVDRLVLDSVVPMTGFDATMVDVFPEVARVLTTVCAAAGCGRDPAADLAATVHRWPDLSPALLDALTTMSVLDPTYPGVLAALAAGAAGQDGPARALVSAWRQRSAADAALLSQGLHASTLCLDLDFAWGGADTEPATRPAAVEASVAAEDKAGRLAPFDAGAAGGNGFVATCQVWPRTADGWSAADAREAMSGLAQSGPKTLVLAGDRDLSTPLVWSKAAAAALPGSRLVVVPGAGHSVQSRGPTSAGEEATRFLLAP